MSRHQVCTTALNGSDKWFLGRLAHIDGLQWSHTLPGGPEKIELTFHQDSRFNHRALVPGRLMIAYVGAGRAWAGMLTDPGRGNPWKVRGDGFAVLINNMRAAEGASGNPYNLNEVFDAAVARGLMVTRPNLPTGSANLASLGGGGERPSLARALTRALLDVGKTWYVDNDGDLQLQTPFVKPTHLLLTSDPGGGRTVSGHVSAYLVHYHDASRGKQATLFVRNAALEGKNLPIIEKTLDLRHRGSITAAVAATIAQAQLLLFTGARMPWADSFTFSRGMIRTLAGSVVDPATVSTPLLGRMLATDPDHIAETNYTFITDMFAGRTVYNDDTDTLTVEPFDFEGTDFKDMLGKAFAGRRAA